jgi:hypothetical protein
MLALPCLGGDNLWKAFRDTPSPEAAHALLKDMPSKDILRLCREYGALVDAGAEPAEAPVIPMAISVLGERRDLSQDTFLTVLGDATAPTYWRALCAEWSADSSLLTPMEQLSIETAFHSLTGVLNDTSAPDALRETAAVATGKLLRDGYFWVYRSSVGKKLMHDKADLSKVRNQQSPIFVRHDARVERYFDILMGDIPEKVRLRGVSWVWRIADVRGEKTPRIHDMQRFLEKKAARGASSQADKKYRFAKDRLDRNIRQ